jgi:hypothetical protein
MFGLCELDVAEALEITGGRMSFEAVPGQPHVWMYGCDDVEPAATEARNGNYCGPGRRITRALVATRAASSTSSQPYIQTCGWPGTASNDILPPVISRASATSSSQSPNMWSVISGVSAGLILRDQAFEPE